MNVSQDTGTLFLKDANAVDEAHNATDTRSEDCVEWASSLPENLDAWVIGLSAVLSVVLFAVDRNQPLAQMKMPFLQHIIPTLGMSITALVLLVVSTSLAAAEFVRPTTESVKCDALRVVWTLTPVVTGTAGAGCIFLVWVAYNQSVTMTKNIKRDSKDRNTIRISIPPGDSYGNGTVAIKAKSFVWVLNTVWSIGTLLAGFYALRGELLSGLFSVAGVIAVWTNTILPIWNPSQDASGFDTVTQNTLDLDCIELNVIGDNFDQTAIVIRPKSQGWLRDWRLLGSERDRVHYVGAIYGMANAHAASTEFKGDAFQLVTYAPFIHDLDQLANAVVMKTAETRARLATVFSAADVSNPAHRAAFTALTAAVLDTNAWAGTSGQRRRFRAAFVAQAWLTVFRGQAGVRIWVDDASLGGTQCNLQTCSNPLHRWTRFRTLEDTAEEEARYLLGSDAILQPIKPGFEQRAAEFWRMIKAKVGSEQSNSSLLLSVYIVALQTMGAVFPKNLDYFPTFDLELKPFSEEDFGNLCTFLSTSNVYNGKPLVEGSLLDRKNQGYHGEYNMADHPRYANERSVSIPFHPKVILHVAVRVLHRSILVQTAIWALIGFKQLLA